MPEDAVRSPQSLPLARAQADKQGDARRRQEEEELARVLELSKQDKGGRNTSSSYTGTGSSSSAAAARPQAQAPAQSSYQPYQSSYATNSQPSAALVRQQVYEPEVAPLDINTATRVRALYAFTSVEIGELNFERGDVIKVLDRGFKEWWRGACNGRIGVS